MEKKSNEAKVDYIELPGKDLVKTKAFYEQVFGWRFTDYGPDYTSFEDGRLAGGFSKERQVASGGPLIVIYGHDLPATERKVVEAGGTNFQSDVLISGRQPVSFHRSEWQRVGGMVGDRLEPKPVAGPPVRATPVPSQVRFQQLQKQIPHAVR